MCYNVSYLEKKIEKLKERYKEAMDKMELNYRPPGELPLFYFVNGFVHPQLPFVKADGIELFEWGLIPAWVKDAQGAKDIRKHTLNAVSETVFEKPSFRGSIMRKRGILPVSGFFEWRDFAKKKYPYLIQLKEEEIFSLGCIYEYWTDKTSGEVHQTFSILTTAANPLMQQIHNQKQRMPLIIDRADEKAWLNPELSRAEIEALMKPFPAEKMKAITISNSINSPRNERNIPEILEEVKYDELPGLV